MENRDTLYSDYKEFTKFIDKELNTSEELTATEVVAVGALERRKAQLESIRVKAQQSLEDTIEKIAKLDSQIARMKAT